MIAYCMTALCCDPDALAVGIARASNIAVTPGRTHTVRFSRHRTV